MYLPQIVDTHDTGYTLFRQAIVERDAEAWANICTCYQPLLMRWANLSCASMAIDESSRDLADHAFARVGSTDTSLFRQVCQSCGAACLSSYVRGRPSLSTMHVRRPPARACRTNWTSILLQHRSRSCCTRLNAVSCGTSPHAGHQDHTAASGRRTIQQDGQGQLRQSGQQRANKRQPQRVGADVLMFDEAPVARDQALVLTTADWGVAGEFVKLDMLRPTMPQISKVRVLRCCSAWQEAKVCSTCASARLMVR
jgi:hypothetical protein